MKTAEEIAGTESYRRHCAWAAAKLDEEGLALHHKVWDPTPWVIDVKLKTEDDPFGYDIRQWCKDNIGEASWPIHDRPGAWYVGGATVNNHTDFGFATERMMRQFIARFPDRIWQEDSATPTSCDAPPRPPAKEEGQGT